MSLKNVFSGDKKPLLALVGPTGAGKTTVGIVLAKRLGTEIISVDSRQVYRGFDIGTAKPVPEERKEVVHHLIDIASPWERFSAADFVRAATPVIERLHSQGKLPVLVGGTGLYFRALIDGIFPAPPADLNLRRQMLSEEAEKGAGWLFSQLREKDPAAAARIHPNDLVRIVRALEIYRTTGSPISKLQNWSSAPQNFRVLWAGIERPRKELYTRAEQRIDRMISAGFPGEVKKLMSQGFSKKSPAMLGLGYSRMVDFIDGKCTMEEAVRKFKQDTRHYIKRQMTWFKNDARIEWIEVTSAEEPSETAEKIFGMVERELLCRTS